MLQYDLRCCKHAAAAVLVVETRASARCRLKYNNTMHVYAVFVRGGWPGRAVNLAASPYKPMLQRLILRMCVA